MTTTNPPTNVSSSIKVLVDSVKTPFGAAIVALCFFGLSLVSLSLGTGNLTAEMRANLMYVLIGGIFVILLVIFLLRIVRPTGLTSPPQPITENIEITESQTT